ncbi:ubiquitin carboxyl-terminal hydrolase isozyme L3-like isoform X1 [Acanthaster planci]|uniref:Ubiquitin carboxyl-terminal hydrolase n=1 Tax=Acanthaster planci TaxID=133434 RepID=A0A8B7Z1T1_ACAPL|nr:ubiquitin carboxyl-terminal hydrolase isozyme L3-like isoform X1 [Acanthaster planci]XP_022099563.1 ubiquitin carboxyl-terminal hydrolase isozyme L3-like isoform X1 [Acanthaster planci]
MSVKPHWIPLESNPEVMTKYIHTLGVPNKWHFVDVLGLDDELLGMISKPVVALIVLFPKGDKMKSAEEEMCAKIEKEGQEVSGSVYFMKQTIGNACGTIGVLHAVLNNQNENDFKLAGIISEFADKTKGMDGAARGACLENDAGICEAHSSSAQEGQTQAPPAEESVKPHFVALVHVDGSLYELDGCKPFPVNHGQTSTDSFLKDAAGVCKKIMAIDPSEVNFNIMALTGGEPLF